MLCRKRQSFGSTVIRSILSIGFTKEWILKTKQKQALYLHFTMEDNPSLSQKVRKRYHSLYSGAFYERFVLGKWVAVQGLIYPFMTQDRFCDTPKGAFEEYVVSLRLRHH